MRPLIFGSFYQEKERGEKYLEYLKFRVPKVLVGCGLQGFFGKHANVLGLSEVGG
jgi:hypothetical protein